MKTGVGVLIFDVNRSRIGVGFGNFGAGLESESQKSDSVHLCRRLDYFRRPAFQIGKLVCCAGYIRRRNYRNFCASWRRNCEICANWRRISLLLLLGAKYSIGKNVYLTTATPRKVPRSSDNHDIAVLQCTLTSQYHNEAREVMYRSLSHRSHLIL